MGSSNLLELGAPTQNTIHQPHNLKYLIENKLAVLSKANPKTNFFWSYVGVDKAKY